MREAVNDLRTPMFTHHGVKRKQGYPIKIHGHDALGYFDHDQLVGYTTLDEIHQMFHSRNIPEFDLEL